MAQLMELLWISGINSWNLSTFIYKSGNNTNRGKLCGLKKPPQTPRLSRGPRRVSCRRLEIAGLKRNSLHLVCDPARGWRSLLIVYPSISSPPARLGDSSLKRRSHFPATLVARRGPENTFWPVTYKWECHVSALLLERVGPFTPSSSSWTRRQTRWPKPKESKNHLGL